MPIYEFRCSSCNREFETLVLGSRDKPACPDCKSERLERMLSRCAVKSGDTFTPSTGSSGCASCASHNCSSCH